MKIVVIHCVSAFYEKLQELYTQAEIISFSEFDVKNHKNEKDNDLSTNWFSVGKEYYDSVATFAFVETEKAEKLLALIDNYNKHSECDSPIQGYMMNVEKSV